MSEYVAAFALGNAAILGNVCMLPLYPGLFVLLAARVEQGATSRSVRWMGVVVLAGVLTAMVGLGALLHLLRTPFANVVPYALPAMYALVLVLGLAMIANRNPLARLATGQVPIVRSPTATAFLYGMAIGPMTLPCTGPLIVAAFVVGGVQGSGATLHALTYFLIFGLGFGWPLVVAPLLAAPAQRRISGFLTSHHRIIAIASGGLLIVVAVAGWYRAIRPN